MATNWWDERSAADDGAWDDEPETVWLDDYEFEDEDEDEDRVGGLWNRYAVRDADAAVRAKSALTLVQGLVDTFATGDKPYRVTFDASVETAGTNYATREIVISHKPLYDPTITPAQAETVLTAMAAHEASHVRYGRRTSSAVKNEWPGDALAHRMSNLLDDVRIERRYTSDYPGYAGLFAPAIKYVAESGLRQIGAAIYDPARMTPDTLAVAAVRYADFVDWSGGDAERTWWADWADRFTATDRIALHTDGVREALAHLTEMAQPKQPEQDESGESKSGGEQQQGQGGESGESESGGEQGETQGEAPAEQPTQDPSYGQSLGGCFAERIEQTAEANGVTEAVSGSGRDLQQDVESAKALVNLPNGEQGEVYWGPSGIVKRRRDVGRDTSMSAAIRAAFSKARTGHWAVQHDLRTGRLDSRALPRIASADYRLFTKRTAPSEAKYLTWLLVDCSGSMSGFPIADASRLAGALAAASRFIPNLRLDVWGWTDSFRFGAKYNYETGLTEQGAAFGAVRVWKSGDPLANIGYLPNIEMGGTPDKSTVIWAARAIAQAAQPGEKPLIILASDGSGFLDAETIANVRRSGVEIVSVAIGRLNPVKQAQVFGEDGFLAWTGSIRSMARPLGKLLAKTLAAKSA